jgi:membrane protein implicated in regulation of membrane protease activity
MRALRDGTSKGRRPGRIITILAVGFLALDGALLTMAGMWAGRPALLVWGAVFGAAAVAVFLYWRRYLRQLREIQEGLEARFRELMELSGEQLPGAEQSEE